jgi:Ca2+-binding RTX toxin-like protein
LQGGLGDDTYVVYGGISTITEAANAGDDAVFAAFEESGSITLPQNVEHLLLIGLADDVQITATGTEANDIIEGGTARFRLNGLGGNELSGNEGQDRLYGGAGKDKLDGDDGTDEMRGGTGDDTYFVDTRSDKVIERSGEGNDVVKATSGFTLPSHVENLVLLDTGNTNGTGNQHQNSIVGNAGRNTLSGRAGDDALKGGDGIDILRGGTGQDVLYGGADRDVFDFNSIKESKVGSNRDVIQDFKHGNSVTGDDIDLRDIDAKSGVSGNNSFKFIGKQDFHGAKGELRYKDLGDKCLVQGDVNGDGNAEFEILVKAGSLSAGDFLL